VLKGAALARAASATKCLTTSLQFEEKFVAIASKLPAGVRRAVIPVTSIVEDVGEIAKTAHANGVQETIMALEEIGDDATLIAKGETLAQTIGQVAKNSGVLVGNGSELRKVKFFRALQHGKKNHFFGLNVKDHESLRMIDPNGNPEKWLQYVVHLAQNGAGPVKNLPTGQMMEIMGKMAKSNSTETLDVGIRLFKMHGEDIWKAGTILTNQ
jgi:hypothetical protein